VLDLLIEARSVQRIEPGAELIELIGRQPGNGPFKIFDGYRVNIADRPRGGLSVGYM
jgi:hypothetical protein